MPLSKQMYCHYMELPQPDNVVALTYIFLDANLQTIRHKVRIVDYVPETPEDAGEWPFSGAPSGHHNNVAIPESEMYLLPVAIFKDPFLGGNNRLVLSQVFSHDRKPHESNTRYPCETVMKLATDQEPWFGFEQEFVMFDTDGQPLGWPKNGVIFRKEPFHCGVGASLVSGREIMESHFKACAYAGVKIAGYHMELYKGQWEYQIGPCEGISFGDHVWMARFILQKIAEDFGADVSFHPKPVRRGDFHGSGGHVNFSTNSMREEKGIVAINKAIEKLAIKNSEHIEMYGKENAELRLKGIREAPDAKKFTSGVGTRTVSVRIPRHVHADGKGYLEDRRPGSDIDPYLASQLIVQTCCLDK